MSTTKINVSGVLDQSCQLNRAKNHISSAKSDVSAASNRIDAMIQSRSNMKARLSSVHKQLISLESEIGQLKAVAEKGASSYQSTDNNIRSWQNDLQTRASRISNPGSPFRNGNPFR